MKKLIPVGYEDIKRMVDKDMYYVDKTLMIKELVDSAASVNLITRPRRFGKTLNLSMLRRFFELELNECGEKIENSYIFQQLDISACGARYLTLQERYPVINVSLKSAKQPTYELSYIMLKKQIQEEFDRHKYVLDASALDEREKIQYEEILALKEEESLYIDALRFLSMCLYKYHGEHVIILIDEYDVPLENAYMEGFYDEMTGFIRSLFESALKTNPSMEFAVITGCLRISKESIFTGLNNLEVYSVLSPGYADCFGFTENEVRKMLSCYGLDYKFSELKGWYDGYLFGEKEIYNPWSIINYIKTATMDPKAFPKPYWSNTSSNSIVRELIERADMETKEEVEKLINGASIERPVQEDITYADIYDSKDNLWSFFFFTGYLKKTKVSQGEGGIYLTLSVPNAEIRSIYRNTVLVWFDKKIQQTDMSEFFQAIENGDSLSFGNFVSNQPMESISFFDYGESYYHGFLMGF